MRTVANFEGDFKDGGVGEPPEARHVGGAVLEFHSVRVTWDGIRLPTSQAAAGWPQSWRNLRLALPTPGMMMV